MNRRLVLSFCLLMATSVWGQPSPRPGGVLQSIKILSYGLEYSASDLDSEIVVQAKAEHPKCFEGKSVATMNDLYAHLQSKLIINQLKAANKIVDPNCPPSQLSDECSLSSDVKYSFAIFVIHPDVLNHMMKTYKLEKAQAEAMLSFFKNQSGYPEKDLELLKKARKKLSEKDLGRSE